MTSDLKLYRKRFIPDEVVYLKDDQILFVDSEVIITKWNCLKPRKDIARGYSAYYLSRGFKVNKVYNSNNELVYWYCDIITHSFDVSTNSLIVTDLLVDILIYPDNSTRILDLDEVADGIEQSLLPVSLACEGLRKAHSLLSAIYDGSFSSYQERLNGFVEVETTY